MIHRAIYGSLERFFGSLIEFYAGRFPLWLSPRQVTVLTVADRHLDYAKTLVEAIRSVGLLCDLDDSAESVGKKIREAQVMQVNYMLTVGDREVEHRTVALRTRDNVVHGELKLEEFVAALIKERDTKALISPFHK